VQKEIEDVIGLDASHALLISAKTGQGVDDVLEAIVERMPPPEPAEGQPLKALIFDSWFDPYLGAMVMIRVLDGVVRKGDRIRMMQSAPTYEVTRVGVFAPRPIEVDKLGGGEGRFLAAGIKDIAEARVGDTITLADRPCAKALPGFMRVKPMVFAGLYPIDSAQYEQLRDAIDKLRPERLFVHLRAGDVHGARLRVPLRLPRIAAHRDHAGAARARVRVGAHHDRANGRL
jgi:GTP-binding protein LepA